MQKNPNVTVRSRGVMEKCTYCVQRIETAKISQRVKAGVQGDLTLPTDSVQSACQQACPAEAIVFGDMKDPKSRVAQLRKLPQNYHLLEYLNLQTRTAVIWLGFATRIRRCRAPEESAESMWTKTAIRDTVRPQAETQTTGGNA